MCLQGPQRVTWLIFQASVGISKSRIEPRYRASFQCRQLMSLPFAGAEFSCVERERKKVPSILFVPRLSPKVINSFPLLPPPSGGVTYSSIFTHSFSCFLLKGANGTSLELISCVCFIPLLTLLSHWFSDCSPACSVWSIGFCLRKNRILNWWSTFSTGKIFWSSLCGNEHITQSLLADCLHAVMSQ